MVTVEGTRDRLRYSLEQALEAADDEQARYHIRIAAQRLVVLQWLGGPEGEPTVDGLLDEPAPDDEVRLDRTPECSTEE
jgi:hypothetical protein